MRLHTKAVKIAKTTVASSDSGDRARTAHLFLTGPFLTYKVLICYRVRWLKISHQVVDFHGPYINLLIERVYVEETDLKGRLIDSTRNQTIHQRSC